MINLLPPAMKEQMHYAKLNRMVLRYLRVTVVVAVVLAGIFVAALYLVKQQTTAVISDTNNKQKTIDELNRTFAPKAKEASDRLAAIKYVQDSQTHFSAVVADIAKVIPKGVSIDSMTLTGNDSVPLKILVTAQTYQDALALRNALTTSPRVAGADLESIAQFGSQFKATVVVAFKPGQAK